MSCGFKKSAISARQLDHLLQAVASKDVAEFKSRRQLYHKQNV
jgi:hypothetical protein